jgi:hypothetical protein
VLAVNASLFPRARAERFAQLVEEANGGRRRHHSRNKGDDEVAGLVAKALQLQAIPLAADPDPIFRRDLRAQLMAAAERDGIGVTAQPEAKPNLRKRLVHAGSGKSRARGAVVVGIAAGTLVLSGVSVASGEAMPGDALYGMKRSTEKAQLALAGSDLSRGQLYLDFARTRLHEAASIRSGEPGFVAALHDMDSDTQQGIRMLVTSALTQNDTTALDAIDKFVASQRTLAGRLLDLSSANGRQKVTESLALISKIEQRAVSARAALACGVKAVGNDDLGPVPGNCSPAGAPKHQGTGTAPAAAGQGTGEQAATTTAATQTPSPSASPTPEKKDDGLLGELGRILGGLLG